MILVSDIIRSRWKMVLASVLCRCEMVLVSVIGLMENGFGRYMGLISPSGPNYPTEEAGVHR